MRRITTRSGEQLFQPNVWRWSLITSDYAYSLSAISRLMSPDRSLELTVAGRSAGCHPSSPHRISPQTVSAVSLTSSEAIPAAVSFSARLTRHLNPCFQFPEEQHG